MHFTVEAQRIVGDHLAPGAIAVDATAGNGHDTLFLAEAVGRSGQVIAIDIQPTAIEAATRKLAERGWLDRVALHVGDHAALEQIVAPKLHTRVSCVMFNLGYLPLGDKTITTSRDSTIRAISGAARLLKPGGLLSVLAYVGHAGGREEAAAVADWMAAHSAAFDTDRHLDAANADSPVLWIARKRVAD